jgi:predicted N-acetyltransferase YhbS
MSTTSGPPPVVHLPSGDLARPQIEAIGRLIALAFPTPGYTPEDRITGYADACKRAAAETFAVFAPDGRALAHAWTFPREIATASGRLRVLALAGVCSDPEVRGAGLGRAVVLAAFARIEACGCALSLFQTGVPDFYAKLGSRLVHNRFFDSLYVPPAPGARPTNGTRDEPWWNPHVMIHPAGASWPDGSIDLLGPGW